MKRCLDVKQTIGVICFLLLGTNLPRLIEGKAILHKDDARNEVGEETFSKERPAVNDEWLQLFRFGKRGGGRGFNSTSDKIEYHFENNSNNKFHDFESELLKPNSLTIPEVVVVDKVAKRGGGHMFTNEQDYEDYQKNVPINSLEKRGGGRIFMKEGKRGGGRIFMKEGKRGGGRIFMKEGKRGGGRIFMKEGKRGGGHIFLGKEQDGANKFWYPVKKTNNTTFFLFKGKRAGGRNFGLDGKRNVHVNNILETNQNYESLQPSNF
uniref:FMRFamide-related neuropeptides-like n=1 Tax=Rhabditophanes sp. KR3021 TaxID=114890 RepID=A0AC35UEP4_9BILA